MFFSTMSQEQKEQFIEDRMGTVKEKLDAIKSKIEKEKTISQQKSYNHVLTYLEHHLKAELNWLKTLS